MRGKSLRAMVAVTALVAALCVGEVTATANVSQGYVAATTIFLDEDWDDEGEVSRYAHAYSAATGLWQAVLWADGAIERDGTRFDASDIDCEFGPNSEAATMSWQRTTGGLAVDGRAGPRTWTRAGDALRLVQQYQGGWIVEYRGRYNGRTFRVARHDAHLGGAYSTSSWDPIYTTVFTYRSKPSNCSGVPAP